MINFKTFIKNIIESNETAGAKPSSPFTGDKTFTPTDSKEVWTTPKELSQRALSKTPKSAGDVSTDFVQKWDTAFQTQVQKFKELSPENQETVTKLYGDPTKKEYTDTSVAIVRGKYNDPMIGGYARAFNSGRNEISLADNQTDLSTILPHEMTHIQQFRTDNPKLEAEFDKTVKDTPYFETPHEIGADTSAGVAKTRASKSSDEERLAPLSDEEVDQSLERARERGYGPSGSMEKQINDEIKNYLRYKIVKKDTQDGTAIA